MPLLNISVILLSVVLVECDGVNLKYGFFSAFLPIPRPRLCTNFTRKEETAGANDIKLFSL